MKKRISKKSIMLVTVVVLTLFNMVGVYASGSSTHEVDINEVFQAEDGTNEMVIRINEDGSYVTQPEGMTSVRASCRHTNLSAYKSYKETKKSDVSSKCFMIRTVSESKCMSCGRRGFKNYGIWTYRAHDYSLLGKCKTCGKKR